MAIFSVIGKWSEKHAKNVYNIRSFGGFHISEWIDSNACRIHSDLPVIAYVFDKPFFERKFLRYVQDTIIFEDSWKEIIGGEHIPGWIPEEERIVGEKYLEDCGHYHTWNPLPEGVTFEEHMIKTAGQNIADAIDIEILESLLKNHD